ncbi:hypothetical protein IEQ34_006600 [Dendrobium chrysotoxum]|uniref:Uncharacterized protein n=1 Tax=Dendrobium chrysotoxum TaxID=161865 RepID=A0AAV7GQU5_DENCH|nr:hypothetical protein IEQ34_006600 [Dendrobium chrysotoxum]
MRNFPVHRLTRSRTIIHNTANRTSPKLMPPRLRPPASTLRTHPQSFPIPSLTFHLKPFHHKPIHIMSLHRRHGTPKITKQRTRRNGQRPRFLIRQNRSQLQCVRLKQKSPPFADVLFNAVAVLKTVAELS